MAATMSAAQPWSITLANAHHNAIAANNSVM
jgi:hypothetical protein